MKLDRWKAAVNIGGVERRESMIRIYCIKVIFREKDYKHLQKPKGE